MNSRTAYILEAAIKEFIASGEPVSSGRLHDHYNFGIQPAMIRQELSDLAEQGFLEQPHHSAGRVPTNRGFQFFAELVIERTEPVSPREDLASAFWGQAWSEFLGELSGEPPA